MSNEGMIKNFQNQLKNILTSDDNDPGGFADKIDKFKIADLVDYWNTSVQDFYDKMKNLFKQEDKNGQKIDKMQTHNAATKTEKYVKPFINVNKEDYLNARNDENYEVLNDYTKLDFTFDQNNFENLENYITRLIMPQYKRKVEIEDLDRNFWVIGQNLTLLNELILSFGNLFLNQLIGELTGLWDNIYRIWQALLKIVQKIEDFKMTEKIRVIMNYDSAIIPYIEVYNLDGKNVNCIYYNKYIDQYIDKNQEELIELFCNKPNNLISLDCNTTKRDIKTILKMVRERNFVLISIGSVNKDTKWDLLSLISANDIEDKFLYSHTKTIKAEHLWIDFVSNETSKGVITSFTENNFGNQKLLLSYDFNITIPIEKDVKCKYEDFIRINKPYPNLHLINNTEKNQSINNPNNWLGYGEDDTDFYNCIDGFYGIPLNNYPSKDNTPIDLSNYPNCFKFISSELFKTNISSSDLIDCTHDGKGQTRKDNQHNFKNPVINLRYINGRKNNQEIEIITTKDKTDDNSRIFKRIIEPKYEYIGSIYNTSGEDDSSNKPYYLKIPIDENYREERKLQNIYLAPQGEETGNYLWVPINEVADIDSFSMGGKKENKISISRIWEKNILQDAITYRLLKKYDDIKDYDYRVILTNFRCFIAGKDTSVGKHFAYLFLIYREPEIGLKIEKICDMDYSLSFLNGSEMSEAVIKWAKDNYNGADYAAINAYCPYMVGFWTSNSFAKIESLSYKTNPFSVSIGKLTFGIESNGTVNYKIWGPLNGKIWSPQNASGNALKSYTIKKDSYNYDEGYYGESTDLYAGLNISDEKMNIVNTNIKIFENGKIKLSPWSNPINGVGFKEWGVSLK